MNFIVCVNYAGFAQTVMCWLFLKNPLYFICAVDTRISQTRSLMENACKKELKAVEEINAQEEESNETDANEENKETKDKNTGEDETKKGNKDKKYSEDKFWIKLADTLKPESANLSKVEELKEKLRNLRNLSVLIIFLVNVMWIVFLYTLVFPQLTKYNLPDKAFSLLFLFIFSVIVLIQFVAMIFHRFKTLLHLLAGIRPKGTTLSQTNPKKKVKNRKKADSGTTKKPEKLKEVTYSHSYVAMDDIAMYVDSHI